MCGRTCGHHRAPCFHDEYLSAKLDPVSPKFLAATEYSYTPSLLEERQRQSLIQHILAAKLEQGYLKQLA